jgi:hypothetical protein
MIMNVQCTQINAGRKPSALRFLSYSAMILSAFFGALLTVPSASAQATNVYITPDGSGQGVCTSNPHTPTWFNNSSNWGSGATQIGPGTTVHLCGTFTGAAGAGLLTFQGSGSNGSPITLLFDTNTVLQAPYWQPAPISMTGKSWITVDGGSNGLIQNTANGTGLTYQQPSGAVNIVTSSNIVIQNLTIANICQHTQFTDTTGCIQGGGGDGGMGIKNGATNITVTKNTIHDTLVGIYYGSVAGDSNVVISNNTISRVNWGIGVAPSGISNGLTITGNDISCVVGAACNWDASGNANFHHNGIMIFPINIGDMVQGVVISNNYIHDINGATTAGIFLDPSNGDVPNAKIFNNVFYTAGGQSGPANAWITDRVGVSGALIVNNTIAGYGAHGLDGQLSPTFENNIVQGVGTGEYLLSGFSAVVSDYNDWYNLTGAGAGQAMCASSCYGSIASWIAANPAFDLHSITSNPNLAANFTLNAGSPAIGAGKNLTSLGIAGLNVGAPQTFGAKGSCGTGCVARPTQGPWDLGAYPTGGSSSQPIPPAALSGQLQ